MSYHRAAGASTSPLLGAATHWWVVRRPCPSGAAVARRAGPVPLVFKRRVQFGEDFWHAIFDRPVGCWDRLGPRLPINRGVMETWFHTGKRIMEIPLVVFFFTPHTRPPDESGHVLCLWC
jgi:hypothetical protein